MSWEGYIDSLQAKSAGNVTRATIIGFNGSMWTPVRAEKPSILPISAEEAKKIGTAMAPRTPSVATEFQMNGIIINGVKYMFLRVDDDGKIILGKKKDHGAITMVSTKQAVIIAETGEGKQQGNSNQAASEIAKYLEDLGY
jgi:profilin